MKKILFALTMLVMAATASQAQTTTTNNGNNATLLQPAGSYIFYGDQVMKKNDCAEFLAQHHQPAYEKFQSGMKCVTAGWATLGAGLAVDLAGSILWAFSDQSDAMFYSGASCVIAGSLAIIAALPTVYIGYIRMNDAIDMYNVSAATGQKAYLSIQGSQNGVGLALHF